MGYTAVILNTSKLQTPILCPIQRIFLIVRAVMLLLAKWLDHYPLHRSRFHSDEGDELDVFVEKLAEMVKGLALIDNELRLADSDMDVDDPDMLND
jgi:hypothetical protein